MNPYLESLQLKSEFVEPVSEEAAEITEEVVSNVELPEEITGDTAEPAATVEDAQDEPAVEDAQDEPAVQVSDGPADVADEVPDAVAVKEVTIQPAAEPVAEPVAPACGLKEGDVVKVSCITIYKTPDIKQIAKNYAGNVTFLGKIGDFSIVSYMRHGFGLVKGYTLDELQ